MGYAQLVEHSMTVEEYFEIEKRSEIRHEYYNGEIYAMAGTTLNHNRIVGKIRNLLSSHFVPRGCDVFSENIKVKVSDIYYPYPDVMVTCAQSDISGSYIVEHPGILVEVLSKTSAAYDRGFKLRKYKEIPSLRYYLLVSQNEYLIELYTRTAQENIWIYQNFERENDVVRFDIWDFEMSLKAIYENITFVPDEVL